MDRPAEKAKLVYEYQGCDGKQVYVFYYRESSGKSVINYTNDKPTGELLLAQRAYLNKQETKIFESFLFSEEETKKQALHEFFEVTYKPLRNPKGVYFKNALVKLADIYYRDSKLAKARHQIARKIDKVFGTKLEEKKISDTAKRIEKAISDKFFKER